MADVLERPDDAVIAELGPVLDAFRQHHPHDSDRVIHRAYEQAREAHKQARMSVDEKQLQLREREARIQDLQGKLNSASSNREYQALKDQMAAQEMTNSVLTNCDGTVSLMNPGLAKVSAT